MSDVNLLLRAGAARFVKSPRSSGSDNRALWCYQGRRQGAVRRPSRGGDQEAPPRATGLVYRAQDQLWSWCRAIFPMHSPRLDRSEVIPGLPCAVRGCTTWPICRAAARIASAPLQAHPPSSRSPRPARVAGPERSYSATGLWPRPAAEYCPTRLSILTELSLLAAGIDLIARESDTLCFIEAATAAGRSKARSGTTSRGQAARIGPHRGDFLVTTWRGTPALALRRGDIDDSRNADSACSAMPFAGIKL